MNNWIELEEKHGTGVYGNWPVALDKGKGSFVWDTNGMKYLDFGSGLGVVGIGHANETIALVGTKTQNLIVLNDLNRLFVKKTGKNLPSAPN